MVDCSLLEISPVAFAALVSLLLSLSPSQLPLAGPLLWCSTNILVFPKGFTCKSSVLTSGLLLGGVMNSLGSAITFSNYL